MPKEEVPVKNISTAKKYTNAECIGLDLSLTGTGVAITDDGVNFDLNTLAPPKHLVGMARISWILASINHLPPAKLFIIEELAFSAHDRNHERAGLAYMIRYLLWRKKIPYVLIAPTSLKKWITGSGKGDKSRIMLEVYKRWAIDTSNDNEADACGLCKIGVALLGTSARLPKHQLECLKTIRKTNQALLDRIAA